MNGCRLTDKVTALEVEAVQLVARLLRIHDVFIDNESSALCVACNALADLAAGDISTSKPTAYHGCHVPNGPVLAEELKELLRCHVVARGNCQHRCVQIRGWGGGLITNLRFLTNKALDMMKFESAVLLKSKRGTTR